MFMIPIHIKITWLIQHDIVAAFVQHQFLQMGTIQARRPRNLSFLALILGVRFSTCISFDITTDKILVHLYLFAQDATQGAQEGSCPATGGRLAS
jgi:hypothetical protein